MNFQLKHSASLVLIDGWASSFKKYSVLNEKGNKAIVGMILSLVSIISFPCAK